MASWFLNDVEVKGISVEFGDIKEGDEIIVLYVPDDGSGDVKLWKGFVWKFVGETREWFGPSIEYAEANDYWNVPFGPLTKIATPDGSNRILIVAENLEDEEISLFKVVPD